MSNILLVADYVYFEDHKNGASLFSTTTLAFLESDFYAFYPNWTTLRLSLSTANSPVICLLSVVSNVRAPAALHRGSKLSAIFLRHFVP